MKKIVLFVCFFLISNTCIVNSGNILSYNEKNKVNIIGKKIEKLINNKGIGYKKTLIKSLEKYKRKTSKNSKAYFLLDELISKTYKSDLKNNYLNHYNKYKINYKKVKNYWLKIHNDARKNLKCKKYSYDSKLDNSAYERSCIQKQKGIMEHKRNPGDSYYDYHKIESWFNQRGINCKVINRTTSSESIGRFGYYCTDNDCTDELEESIKVIFDIYMAEKGTGRANDAHYRAIAHPDITKMGLGISIRQTDEKDYYEYYITTHYCTEFKS